MKKRVIAASIAAASLLATTIPASLNTEVLAATPTTLKILTLNATMLPALNTVGQQLSKQMPGVSVQATSVPTVTQFNTIISTDITTGNMPDIIIYQWGTQTIQFASQGDLLDLTKYNLTKGLNAINTPLNKYKGKVYGVPVDQTVQGVLFNVDVAKKYGVNTYPKTWSQLLADCKTLQKNGLATPFTIAGQDTSGATSFFFQYLYTVTEQKDPNFYRNILTGKEKWNGPEVQQLMQAYAKLLPYANKDLVSTTPTEAMASFVKGDAVFYMGTSGTIPQIRQIAPKLNFELVPPMFVSSMKNYVANSDYDNVVSISKQTKNQKAAVQFLKDMYTPANAALLAESVGSISAVKAAKEKLDPALNPDLPLLKKGDFIGFTSRQWIPGIKDVMQADVQKWMSGTSINAALTDLQAQQERLQQANPDFLSEFNSIYGSGTQSKKK